MNASITAALLWLAALMALICGYFMNIMDILGPDPMASREFVIRLVGLFIAPLGAFMGLFF